MTSLHNKLQRRRQHRIQRSNFAAPKIRDLVDPNDLSWLTRQLALRPGITVVNFNNLARHLPQAAGMRWNETVVVDASLDPWGVPEELDQAWAGRDYWVLTNDAHDTRPRHVYFPQWLLQHANRWHKAHRPGVVAPRQFKASCLNRYPRLHRYYTVRQILDRDWRKQSLLSLARIDWDPYNNHFRKPHAFVPLEPKFAPLVQWWTRQNLPIQDHPEPQDRDLNDHTLGHPAYWNTYCNIITESSVLSPGFMSEKTAKPLAAGQLWCMVSGSGTVKVLRDLGFDVMDDVWRQHVYLDHEDWTARIDHMMQTLDTVITNIEDVWQRTATARQHNQDWLFNRKLHRRILQPLYDRELLIRS